MMKRDRRFIRSAVDVFVALLVRLLMAAGTHWTKVPKAEVPAVALLSGFGVVVHVLFFA